jgi:hypothetical protein
MTVVDLPGEARPALRFKLREELARLDRRRAERRLVEDGYSPARVSRWVRVPQAEVAGDVPMPLEGFSGATPFEICERYGAGEIDRAQVVDELARFPYAPRGETDGYDWLAIDAPGSFSEVEDAHTGGLIDDAVYRDVFDAMTAAGV